MLWTKPAKLMIVAITLLLTKSSQVYDKDNNNDFDQDSQVDDNDNNTVGNKDKDNFNVGNQVSQVDENDVNQVK